MLPDWICGDDAHDRLGYISQACSIAMVTRLNAMCTQQPRIKYLTHLSGSRRKASAVTRHLAWYALALAANGPDG